MSSADLDESKMVLDEGDLKVLRVLQTRSDQTLKEVAVETKQPVTTVHSKVKRLEQTGVIRGYRAILDSSKLERSTAAFILVSVVYRTPEAGKILSQRETAKEIARFREVQEVHIITGDWDLLVKVRAKDVDSVGRFVIDRLRTVKGVDRTLTSIVFHTEKETLDLDI